MPGLYPLRDSEFLLRTSYLIRSSHRPPDSQPLEAGRNSSCMLAALSVRCQVSSAAGKLPAPTQGVYAASKHALQGYFHTLASEVAFSLLPYHGTIRPLAAVPAPHAPSLRVAESSWICLQLSYPAENLIPCFSSGHSRGHSCGLSLALPSQWNAIVTAHFSVTLAGCWIRGRCDVGVPRTHRISGPDKRRCRGQESLRKGSLGRKQACLSSCARVGVGRRPLGAQQGCPAPSAWSIDAGGKPRCTQAGLMPTILLLLDYMTLCRTA